MQASINGKKYPAVLAAVAAGVLAAGILLKPPKKLTEPVVVSPWEMARLEKLAQKKSLEDMSSYFSGLAGAAALHLVFVQGLGVSGLVWDGAGLVVTADPSQRLPLFADVLTASGETSRGQLAVSSPFLGTAAVRLENPLALEPARLSAPRNLRPGDWIVQVSRGKNGQVLFAPGTYSGTIAARCGDFNFQEIQTSLPLSAPMLGGGIFDMEGGLLGVVLTCGERLSAAAVPDVQAALRRGETFAGQVLARYGLRMTDLDDWERNRFRAAGGVLVTEVWEDRLADRAGLIPGDLIVEMDGEPVQNLEDLNRLVLPINGLVFELKVRRGQTTAQIALPATSSSLPVGADPKLFGLRLETPQRGYLIEAVDSGTPAQRAGVRAGDRLLRVEGRPVSGPVSARRLLSAAVPPSYLVVERSGKKLALFLR